MHTDIRYHTVSHRGTFKKSLTGLKTNQARGRNEQSAGLLQLASLLSGGQGQCGNVLYVNTDVSQTRWPMALPKCFHLLESGASATTNKQKHGSEVTNWLTGRFWSKEARRQIADGDGAEISSPSPVCRPQDQDLWVVGDRRRGEGVPSRFGRGTGMCPLIRLGNCGRK